jgi:hypothetical protein
MAVEHNFPASQTGTGQGGYHAFMTLTTQTSQPGLVYGTATQASAIYAASTGTGVSTVIRNSAGYVGTLMHSTYDGGGIIPKGGIIMWSGTIATIPFGWALCDGNNGTPNLVDKFVVAAKQDDAGAAKTNITGSLTQSGGSTTISTGNLPAHTHDVTLDSLAGNSAGVPRGAKWGNDDSSNGNATATTTSVGSGDAYTQPYYALAFIQKL